MNLHDQRARLAVGLYDPAKLGQGTGRQAIRLVLDHAFGGLRLHRVGLRVISYNVRAIRAYRACGFTEEGREREASPRFRSVARRRHHGHSGVRADPEREDHLSHYPRRWSCVEFLPPSQARRIHSYLRVDGTKENAVL